MNALPNLNVVDFPSRVSHSPQPWTDPRSELIGRRARHMLDRLTRIPRVCVIGEFNSGKSTLINALVGRQLVPTSIMANTRLPIRTYYAPTTGVFAEYADGGRRELTEEALDSNPLDDAVCLSVGLPQEQLRSWELIDTPGLQSDDCEDERHARTICRQSHLAIWCTPAIQAWKASEANAWKSLPKRYQAGGILAVTFKDKVACPLDQARLMNRIQAEAAPYFRSVVMVSAPAFEEEDEGSGMDELKQALLDLVADLTRLRIRKAQELIQRGMLSSPLSVAAE